MELTWNIKSQKASIYKLVLAIFMAIHNGINLKTQ